MAKRFTEIGKKAENLIEQGNEADKKVSSCQARVASSSSKVAEARRQLARASEMDEKGNPKGNVVQARAQLSVAQNHLAASQRALDLAKNEAAQVKQQKKAHVQKVERHNAVERSNIEKLRELKSKAFASDSIALTAGMAERFNEAEDIRVALLKSMGIDAIAEYVTVDENTGADRTWRNVAFSAIDVSEQGDQLSAPMQKVTDKYRESLREGIRRGVVTEKEIRMIGGIVREKYNRRVASKCQGRYWIKKEEFELAMQMQNVKTSEDWERIVARRKALVQKEKDLEEDLRNMNIAEEVKNILAQHRAIGPRSPSSIQLYQRGEPLLDCDEMIRALDNARNFIPSDWVQKGNLKPIQIKYHPRGYFEQGGLYDTIALGGGKEYMKSNAFHELGHRFEKMYPEILEIERQFYDMRTANEALQSLGAGYKENEVTRFDHFITPYMGKDYEGTAYELLSMGMEGIFCGTYDISLDTEYEDFIFGILLAI